jgi:outer membrane immunogenic protein
MKKLAIAVLAALGALAVPAFAADMALKAPPVVAPVFNWTGWYAGLNVGGSFGEARDTLNVTGGVPASSSTSAHLDGVIGGGQIGYNWLSGNTLFGLEADIQGSSERSSVSDPLIIPAVGCALAPCGTAGSFNDREKLPWFGTVRGRLGTLVSPTVLLFVSGGLAYGQIDSDTSFTPTGGTAVVNNFTTTRAGWTAGGGVEGVVSGNWTAKLEYLYLDFGSFTNSFTVGPLLTPFALSTHVTDNIVRAGVNYHFH